VVDLQRLDARVAGPAVHVPKAAHRLVVDPVVSDQDRAVPVDLDPVLVDQGLVDQADLLLLARAQETAAATLFNLKPPLPLNNPDWPLNNPDSESRAKAAHGLKVKGKGAGARLGKGLDPLLWMLHHEVTVEHARPPRRVGVGKGVSGLAQGLERGKAKSDVWSKYSVLRDKTVRENALARSGEATRAQDVGAGRPPTWCPGLATSRRARSDERGDPRLDPSS